MTLFFDLDGTLTNSEKGILNCARYALISKGISDDNIERLRSLIGPPLVNAFMDVYGVSEAEGIELLQKYRERFATVGMFENEVYEGVPEMLFKLKDLGHKLYVVTGKPEVYSKKIIEHFKLDEYFSGVIGPNLSNTEEGKEELVARAVKLSCDKNAIMVGDRNFDIFGAKANGLRSIGVLYGFGSKEELTNAGADYIANTVEDLFKIIKDEL